MKARIEEGQRLSERDTELAASVPGALITHRRLISEYPAATGIEIALHRVAEMYEDLKRFDLAARHRSISRHDTRLTDVDAWYRAAELYRRRLKDDQAARKRLCARAGDIATSGTHRAG